MPITGDVRDQNMTPVLGINCVKKKITCLFFFLLHFLLKKTRCNCVHWPIFLNLRLYCECQEKEDALAQFQYWEYSEFIHNTDLHKEVIAWRRTCEPAAHWICKICYWAPPCDEDRSLQCVLMQHIRSEVMTANHFG